MKVLDTLRKLNIPIDWATLRLAWEGLSGGRLVSQEDVNKAAEDQLEKCSSEELAYVAELATARNDQTIAEALAALAPDVEAPRAFWKLVCALLEERLSTLPRDPINGLIELSGFWSELGLPQGHPHVFQGVENSLTPAEYYTDATFERLVTSQRRWLAEKIEEVSRA